MGLKNSEGSGLQPSDVAGGLAAHPAQWALHIPERRQDDRPGRTLGWAEFWVTKFPGVPA